jgi:hypothetical protein
MPDHVSLFQSLAERIGRNFGRVALLWSLECQTLKTTIKTLIQRLIKDEENAPDDGQDMDDVVRFLAPDLTLRMVTVSFLSPT